MSPNSSEPVAITPSIIDTVRDALPSDDPYRLTITDHLAAMRGGTASMGWIARTDAGLGYAIVSDKNGVPEVETVATVDDESRIVRALIDDARNHLHASFVWWLREPRHHIAENSANTARRQVVRMQAMLPLAGAGDQLTLDVRAFTHGDADEVVRINNDAFSEHPDRANLDTEAFLKTLHQLGDDYTQLLLIDGAFCWLRPRAGTDIEIYVLAVDRAHQGHGTGRRLLLHALDLAQERRITQVGVPWQTASLYVEHSNTGARRLYESLGFREVDGSLRSYVVSA